MLIDGGGVAAVWEATAALNANAPATLAQPPEVRAFLQRRFLASPAAALLGMGEAVTTATDRVEELAQERSCRCSSHTARTTTPGHQPSKQTWPFGLGRSS